MPKIKPFEETWSDFKDALYAPPSSSSSSDHADDFNPFYWIWILTKASFHYIFHEKRIPYKPFLPFLCYSAMFFVQLSYYIFYEDILAIYYNKRKADLSDLELFLNRAFAFYTSFMIYWNYSITVFSSPGVALPKVMKITTSKTSTPILKSEYTTNRAVALDPENTNIYTTWSSVDGRGGCLGSNQRVNIKGENRRKSLFYNKKNKYVIVPPVSGTGLPRLNEVTICQKCDVVKPPRCHHCSRCNRCILQMDHHCPWMNNCIGYYNYRTFVLSVFFLVIGAWYASNRTTRAFFLCICLMKTNNDSVFQKSLLKILNYFINPNADEMLLFTQTISTSRALLGMSFEKVIISTYPFLIGLSLMLTALLLQHMYSIAIAETTLEQIIHSKLTKDSKNDLIINRYNQGFKRNFYQVFYPYPLLIFLPIRVKPLNPYVPLCSTIEPNENDI